MQAAARQTPGGLTTPQRLQQQERRPAECAAAATAVAYLEPCDLSDACPESAALLRASSSDALPSGQQSAHTHREDLPSFLQCIEPRNVNGQPGMTPAARAKYTMCSKHPELPGASRQPSQGAPHAAQVPGRQSAACAVDKRITERTHSRDKAQTLQNGQVSSKRRRPDLMGACELSAMAGSQK